MITGHAHVRSGPVLWGHVVGIEGADPQSDAQWVAVAREHFVADERASDTPAPS